MIDHRSDNRTVLIVAGAMLASGPAPAFAHGVTEQAQQRMLDGSLLDVVWIGAEHMLTGYDHLLFLLGVLLFLSRFAQILAFITAFTIGHTITLLSATLAGITASPYLIDAAIALTVCYKAIENLDGFRRWLDVATPNLLLMVFVFGLIHGFGLSTRLQEMTLEQDPRLISKILAFNVGVEAGQVAALVVMGAILASWRSSRAFNAMTRATNFALVICGAALFCMQLRDYLEDFS